MKKLIYSLSVLTLIFSCSPEAADTTLDGITADGKGAVKINGNGSPQEQLDAPTLECGAATETNLELTVTAGAKGAAGGFDIHWMTEADFVANNSEWDDELSCAMGFSGNGNDQYSLGAGESITLNLEDMILAAECGTVECGVKYVFRVRAKTEGGQGEQGGLKKSDWSNAFSCATAACNEVCTYGKGYWRNHSNDNPGNQGNVWPVLELELGTTTYSQNELNTILDDPNNEGNNLIIFSQHLIAAKLNVANGAGNEDIVATIAAADEKIGEREVLVDSFPAVWKDEVNAIKDLLEAFNKSNPCSDDE